MNVELESLIDYIVSNREVISESEKAEIFRKAAIVGEDKDEVEMILNGKIALKKKGMFQPAQKQEPKNNTQATINTEQKQVQPPPPTDYYLINDGDLLVRCEFWINLVKTKSFDGEVPDFPVQRIPSKKTDKPYENKTLDSVLNFTGKILDKTKQTVEKVNESGVGGFIISAVEAVNNIVPTNIGNAITNTNDAITNINVNQDTNQDVFAQPTNIYVELTHEEIVETAEKYLALLNLRKSKDPILLKHYNGYILLLDANKKYFEENSNKLGKAFNKFWNKLK